MFGRMFSVFNPGSRGGAIAPQPIILATAGLRIQSGNLTTAQIDTLNASPVLILTGIPGKVIIPIGLYIRSITSASWSNNVGIDLVYDGNTTAIVSAASLTNASRTTYGGVTAMSFTTSILDTTGKGLRLRMASDAIPGGQTCVCRYTVPYLVVDPS